MTEASKATPRHHEMSVITEPKTTYELGQWDLSELIPRPDEATIAQRFADLEEAVRAFESRREALDPGMDPRQLLDILRQYEALAERMNELSGYSSLWFYADTASERALTL